MVQKYICATQGEYESEVQSDEYYRNELFSSGFFGTHSRLCGRNIVLWTSEKKDVWLGDMNLIMLPTQTLLDTKRSPLFISQNPQCASPLIPIILRNVFQQLFWQDNVSVFKGIVGVAIRVVYLVEYLFELLLLSQALCSSFFSGFWDCGH